MEKFGFFNSYEGDRVYDSEDVADYIKTYFTNGITANSFDISIDNGMTLVISEGRANINGRAYFLDEQTTKKIATGDSDYTRIDNLVIRLDTENREIRLKVVEGNPSSSPVAPEIERNSSYYDLVLAQITIPPATSELKQTMIKDTRLNNEVCGVISSACTELDTKTAYKQYEAQFNEWFESIKGKLDGDVAAKLTTQVEELEKRLKTLEDNALYFDVLEEIEE